MTAHFAASVLLDFLAILNFAGRSENPRLCGQRAIAQFVTARTRGKLATVGNTSVTPLRCCLHANAYIVKPGDVEVFCHVIKQLEAFWFSIATLFAGEEVHWEGETVEAPTNGDPQPGGPSRK